MPDVPLIPLSNAPLPGWLASAERPKKRARTEKSTPSSVHATNASVSIVKPSPPRNTICDLRALRSDILQCDEAIMKAKEYGLSNSDNVYLYVFYDESQVWIANLAIEYDEKIVFLAHHQKNPSKTYHHTIYSLSHSDQAPNFTMLLYCALFYMLESHNHQSVQEVVSVNYRGHEYAVTFDHYHITPKSCIDQYIGMICGRWDTINI